MAITVYRYRWRGCDMKTIQDAIDPAIVSSVTNAMAKAWMDVSLDPGSPGSAAQADLDEIMLQMGWIPFSVDPATPLRAVTTKQEIYVPLSVDTNTVSTAFTTLLSTAITTDAGFLDIEASVSASTTVDTFFRLTLDGVAIPDGGSAIGIGSGSSAIVKRIAVTPGAHTLRLMWRLSVAGSSNVQPVTNPDSQHASLFVKEVVA